MGKKTQNIKLQRGVMAAVAKRKKKSHALVRRVINGDIEDKHGIIAAVIRENEKVKEKKQQQQSLLKSIK